MGKDRNEEAKRRTPRRKFERTSKAIADWSGIDPGAVCQAIATVAVTGGALRFGYTSDGGAYSIGIYGDGEPYTEYVRPDEDVEDVLRQIAEAFA